MANPDRSMDGGIDAMTYLAAVDAMTDLVVTEETDETIDTVADLTTSEVENPSDRIGSKTREKTAR